MKSTKMLNSFVFLVFAVVFAMPVIGNAQDKVIRLRFSNFTPVNHPLSKRLKANALNLLQRLCWPVP